jgi:hypothetical protein
MIAPGQISFYDRFGLSVFLLFYGPRGRSKCNCCAFSTISDALTYFESHHLLLAFDVHISGARDPQRAQGQERLRNCQRTFNPTIPSARLEKPDTNCRSAAKRGEQIPNTKLYAVTAYQTGTCVAIYYSIDERREEIHLQEIHRLRTR